MTGDKASAGRVTQIISLLRPERPRRLPASLAAAAASGDLERMQLFLDRGANIEERNAGQSTPLTMAFAHGQKEAKPAGGHRLMEYVGGPYAQEIRTLLEQSPGGRGAGKKGRGT